MISKEVLNLICAAQINSDEAWAILCKDTDPESGRWVYGALRAWTWKALYLRNTDDELYQWHSLMGNCCALWPKWEAKIEVLRELLYESVAIGNLQATNNVCHTLRLASARMDVNNIRKGTV